MMDFVQEIPQHRSVHVHGFTSVLSALERHSPISVTLMLTPLFVDIGFAPTGHGSFPRHSSSRFLFMSRVREQRRAGHDDH